MNYEIFQLINNLAGTYTWLDTSMIYIVKYLSIVFALLLILLSGLGLYFKDKRLIKIDKERQDELLVSCWVFAHGLSTLIATGFFKNPTDEFIEKTLRVTPAK